MASYVLAGEEIQCASCFHGVSSDCRDAFNKMPTNGTLSDNVNTSWSSSSCHVYWMPRGFSAEASAVHGFAQSLINKCGQNDAGCSGVISEDDGDVAMEGGCVCVSNQENMPCACSNGENLGC
ncbi:hypothetical protein N7478_004066 [Penicillium angulare]|uniref:uncharacterized protein n=1 Tax=Penicillium angulare TaxID=116970 RepID=UPI002540B4E7|nr:uncharacterized protein N7478_004066 [Penicillium angulare]KAJ5278694.1 hypothetical protein N7478_004066 [Penicillium angulare]